MKTRTVPTWWLAGLLIAALGPRLLAAPAVRLEMDREEVYVDEALTVTIQISGFRQCEPPQFPALADCSVRELGGQTDSTFVSIVNGRRSESSTRTYQFELTSHAVGELTIPAIAVQVDGRTLSTRARTLNVHASDTHELFAVEITPERSRLYVGQRSRATMTIWIKPAVYGSQRLEPGYMLRRITPLNFGPFPREISNASNVGRRRVVNGQDELHYAFDFETEFIAERPGQLSFDEIEVGMAYPAQGGTRNLRARATVKPAEILPIPMEGRPENFNGAVGLYDITTSARPTTVRVGDPIELTIEVFGDGPVEALPPPLLSADRQLTDSFRVPDRALAGETINARRRFTVTIRAQSDDVTEIPAIEYPYFDPDAERFVIARSDPIPLSVAPAAEVEAPELVLNGTPRVGAGATRLEALDGLHDIETGVAVLLATSRSPSPRLLTSVMLGPPIAFLVTWGGLAFVQSRTADPTRRRRQAALRTARRRLGQARGRPPREVATKVAATLTGYLADRLNEPPARFTGGTALDVLREREVRAELVQQWAAISTRCEEASFAGGEQADAATLIHQALACLTALEREKL